MKPEAVRINPDIEMQVQLMARHLGSDDRSQSHDVEGVEKHAGNFRRLIETHPELIEHFKTDPEIALSEIEAKLYQSESLDQAA